MNIVNFGMPTPRANFFFQIRLGIHNYVDTLHSYTVRFFCQKNKQFFLIVPNICHLPIDVITFNLITNQQSTNKPNITRSYTANF